MKYFTINELTKSSTANRLGIDNTPTEAVEQKLKDLINNILDPLREKWGKPIIVNSGYRCPKLNKAVGGSTTSQHLCNDGAAADIEAYTRSLTDNKKLFDLIKEMKLPFDQLIYEYGNLTGPDWIHVSFGPRNRRKILRAIKSNGKTIYTTML